eukprot:evm.model.scf_540EXC.8 EVM.evm.TU.scf_540EXC.8   scf_540EXC:62082-62744(+)
MANIPYTCNSQQMCRELSNFANRRPKSYRDFSATTTRMTHPAHRSCIYYGFPHEPSHPQQECVWALQRHMMMHSISPLPRLGQQLDGLQHLATDIRARQTSGSNSELLLKASCKNFVVGKARSPWSSNAEFYADRVEYYFCHEEHGKIRMIMFYRDMSDVHLTVLKNRLRFKILTSLAMFGQQYDPQNGRDVLEMEFDSVESVQEYRARASGIMRCLVSL